MFLNRDELALLSRGGRVPRALRPAPAGLHERAVTAAGPAGWRVRLAPGRLRPTRATGRAPAAVAPARAPIPSQRYLELEFAVGFGVEDEQM